MRDEGLKDKVFALITQLRDAREKSCVFSHELRETGRALKALGSIMEEQASSVTMTAKTRTLSVSRDSAVHKITSEQMEQLFDKFQEYSDNETKIDELEKCLEGTGYGKVIKERSP